LSLWCENFFGPGKVLMASPVVSLTCTVGL
jgi:hypothetical protein